MIFNSNSLNSLVLIVINNTSVKVLVLLCISNKANIVNPVQANVYKYLGNRSMPPEQPILAIAATPTQLPNRND